jgi:hypothetical protein
MRNFLVSLLCSLPAIAGATRFTVKSDQSVTADVPRAKAVQIAESDIWRQAYLRCSPELGKQDAHDPIQLAAPTIADKVDGGARFVIVTAQFACGLQGAPDLKQRLDSASSVIVGKVVAFKPVKEERISEHSPSWMIATIDTTETLSGKPAGHVDVYFASSSDVAWFWRPKLQVGQTGVFVLHDGEAKELPGPTVLDPLDVHPADHRDAIWTLLQTK